MVSLPGRGPGRVGGMLLAAGAVWGLYLLLLLGLIGALVVSAAAPGNVGGRFLPLVAPGSVREALVRTHAVASVATLLVLVLGTLFLFCWRLRPGPSLTPILRAPLLLHGFPAALAYLIVFGNAGWLNRILQALLGLSQPPLPLAFSVEALLLFFSIFGLPYFLAYTIVAVGREAADFEDTGRLLGAGPFETFRRVTLPLTGPALRAAACLAYILVAGSLAVPMLIGGARHALLSAEIFSQLTSFADVSRASALALGLALTLFVALTLVERLVAAGVRLLASGRLFRPRAAADGSDGAAAEGARGRRLQSWLAAAYQWGWAALLALLVLTPLYASFVGDWGNSLLPRTWTLRWYLQVDPRFWSSVQLSIVLSFAAVLLTLALGLPLAAAWRFAPLPGKGVLRVLVLLPIGVPGFLWGLSLLVLAHATAPALARGPALLVVGQAFLALPFMVRVLMAALEGLDGEYLAVAAGLGAGRWERTRRVLLPLLLPSIGVGAALVFVRTFGESNLALMVAPTRYQTAPLWLYEAVGVSGIGAASALEVFLVAAPLMVLLSWEAWLRRRAPWSLARAALPV
ncbi:MAG: iron ABC transporter permease [Chloroflexi bacterium]|nr:iron ABC transporter permease [Chloroflexota bacterium]